MSKEWCMVGGWPVFTEPGTAYTFGCGATAWGPTKVTETVEGGDYEGYEKARIMTPIERIKYNKEPITTTPVGGYRCDCCHEFAVYPVYKSNEEPDGAICECCGARF